MVFCLWLCLLIHYSEVDGEQLLKKSASTHLSILLVTVPYPGHLIPVSALGEELVRRGHNVTLCTTVLKGSNLLPSIINQSGFHFWSAGDDFFTADQFSNSFKELKTLWDPVRQFRTVFGEFQRRIFQTVDTPALRSFDILVYDGPIMGTPSLAWKWNIPVITLWPSLLLSPFDLPPWPFPMLGTGFSDDLTFYQRLIVAIERLVLKLVMTVTAPSYAELSDASHLKVLTAPGHYVPMIVCSIIGFEFSRTLSPLTHYVGPILSQKAQDLPIDMEKWLNDKAVRSVVYVSMGSTGYLTRDMAQALMEGIAMANYSVLWSLRKSGQDILKYLDIDKERVFISSWVPQLTVLKHHSISLAVLHGGLGGLQEALSCGVPVLAITPGFNEQSENVVRVQHLKYGETLPPQEVTATRVLEKLETIDSEVYRTSVSKVQLIYKRAGGAPRAAELIEFYSEVGYDHLVPAYARYNWSWVQYYSADVYIILTSTAGLLSWLVYRSLYRLCRGAEVRLSANEVTTAE